MSNALESLKEGNGEAPISDFQFEVLGKQLKIFEQPGNLSSTGTKVWDTGKALCKYFEMNRFKLGGGIKGKRGIEIGAGCGLTGIAMALMGANVFITDVINTLHLIQKNVQYNLSGVEDAGKAQVKELFWGQTKVSSFSPPFHFVFGSDILYQKQYVIPLINVLNELCDTKTVCLLSLEVRDQDANDLFFEKIAETFNVSKIPKTKQHEDYRSEFITIYQLKKKSNES